MRSWKPVLGSALISIWLAALPGSRPGIAQPVSTPTVPGIANFARLQTTIACAGAVTPDALAAIKAMGFASVVNLRLASEPGADVDAEAAAAGVAGLPFFHIPFDGRRLEPAIVDRFLEVVTDPRHEPALIHCASGNRAAAMWLIKRLVVDRWEVERAVAEARSLGLTSPALQQTAIDYAKAHPR